MSKHFETDMANVHREMLSLAGVVEKMTNDAMQALCEQKYDLVTPVLQADATVDEVEVQIEEECLKMLALHQPVASDLRRVTTLIKVNMDVERIGDIACNIAERAQSLEAFPHFPLPDLLPEMASVACDMVRMALDAFINQDSSLAKQVIQTDDKVDQFCFDAITYLRGLMEHDNTLVEPAMHCFSAARHLERIADHAENIAEDVIYMVDGEIVRHQHGEFTSS